MTPCVVLIEQESLLADTDLTACSSRLGGLRWERIPWRDDAPPRLDDRHANLFLLEASQRSERASKLLDWLTRQAFVAPAFAVLPDQLDDDLLQAASRSLDDFVLWPARLQELRERLGRLLRRANHNLESAQGRLSAEFGLRNLVGRDPAFLATVERLPRIAQAEGNVAITGETGTGKEICARAIHHLSARRHAPFIAVDCGAFPESLFENELFGHAAGAFTDARADQRGLAALAEGGVLFLDEIDALSLALQSKLLRFLEERTYKPLGAERFRRADVRVIAASNRDIEACVRAGRFRGDLYFRLNVLRVNLPPLRERRGDIAVLAQHFLESHPPGPGARPRSFAPSALRKLTLHHWPGNVRELLNIVQRALVFCEGPVIHADDLELSLPTNEGEARAGGFREARAEALARFERAYVEELLGKHAGNITRAAREARKERRAFGRLVKKLGLPR